MITQTLKRRAYKPPPPSEPPPLHPGERAALVSAAITTYGITADQAARDVDVQARAPEIVNKLQQALGPG